MSFLDTLKAKTEQLKQVAMEFVTEPATYERRIEICKACPELFTVTNQCKKCGCQVNAKAKIASSKCPISKW